MPSKRKAASASKAAVESSKKKTKRQQVAESASESDFVEEAVVAEDAEIVVLEGDDDSWAKPRSRQTRKPNSVAGDEKGGVEEYDGECFFTSEPLPDEEARKRWPHRYQHPKKKINGGGGSRNVKSNDDEEDEIIPARRHFSQAKVDGQIYNLHDDAYVKAGESEDSYICKIVEMFEAEDGSFHFTAQWFYRAKDTVIGECGNLIDAKCVFFSKIKNDNPLDCLLQKLKIVPLHSSTNLDSKNNIKANCDYYYEKMYLLPYTTFVNLPPTDMVNGSETESTVSTEVDGVGGIASVGEVSQGEGDGSEITLLDLYSGCGGMSTGLCLGANRGDVNLVTRWAVDLSQYACASLRLNHPETQVRNESAEDFLSLLKEWEKLCASFSLVGGNFTSEELASVTLKEDQQGDVDDNEEEEQEGGDGEDDPEVFEVGEVLEICHGDPNKIKKSGLYFKIRWKGYGSDEDTWEPLEGLSGCPEKLREFVVNGYKSKILPLPGKVDVICGGPPCQGISGFNRFRNSENPLADEKNKQLQVFMDIVSFLKPKFILMENVVDIIKFAKGFLGRYALARLVDLGYQARMGMIAAGAYGLPQFRMRVFLWGALPTEKLPQYPLPTHNVVMRGVVPTMFESNVVAYEEGRKPNDLEKELFLGDAISDLPPVENDEKRDEISYNEEPKTNFQHFIRLKKEAMEGCSDSNCEVLNHVLYDHRPLQLNTDDYQRVMKIPRRKGANFRDLEGVVVNPSTKKVEWDPNVQRVYLPSGKPLVPDYAMSFVGGSSSKPFGRLWWDETVPTVVTRAEPHNQVILHPVQDRVLTIRENARLQGFPDYYKLVGPVKERYIQVGNAVAVPVSRALGYCIALSCKGLAGDEPVVTLPSNFSKPVEVISPAESS